MDRINFTPREREALLEMLAAFDLMLRNADKLDRILSMVKYGKRDAKMLVSVSQNLYDKILEVMTLEQLIAFRKNMKGLGVSVRVRQIADDRNKTNGRWLSFGVMGELVKGCHEKCLTCSGQGKEYYDCTLRKALNELPTDLQIIENETGKKGTCPYAYLM